MSDGTMARLYRRVQMLFATGRTAAPADENGPVQFVQVALPAGEVRDKLPILGLYGVVSSPPVGSDVAVLFISGDRSNGVVVATGKQGGRPRGTKPGELRFYNEFGASVYLSESGIRIDGGGKAITIANAPKLRVEGDVEATGEVTARVDGSAIRLSSHPHDKVQSGNGRSGPPVPG